MRRDDQPVGTLVSELGRELGTLLRKETELARAEMSENVSHALRSAASMLVGGAVLFAGLLLLLHAAALALVGPDRPPAVAAAIVAGGALLVGTLLVLLARWGLRRHELTPRRTLEALRRDVHLAQEHTAGT